MTDIGTVLEVVLETGIKEAGKMINETSESGNGHKKKMPATGVTARGKQVEQDSDFAQDTDSSYLANPSEQKAFEHYKLAKECMAKLNRLQALAAYRSMVDGRWILQLDEAGSQLAYDLTLKGPLKPLHKFTSERVPSIEFLVCQEIDVMADMQKHVGLAIDHSQATINELERYDKEIVIQFDKVKKNFLSLEEEIAKTQREIAQLDAQLGSLPMEDPQYVPVKQKFDSQRRHEKETWTAKEISAQSAIYTYKQSGLVQRKEDIVRSGLHQLKLVNDYVTSFLDFVQHTRAADAIIPQLVETAQVVSESYTILSTIFDTENKATTQAINDLVSAVKGVNHTVYPNAVAEVRKQKVAMNEIEKGTDFSEQASRLLRGSYAAKPQAAGQAAKQEYAA